MPPATEETIAALNALREEVERCNKCALGATRTRAVFGDGDPGADLMFVGEAPGYHEDQQGRPFVGQAGKLLEELLASIGLTREQVFIANVLKSRPPNNRDPQPQEIEACRPYLWRQIELIRPKVICTLGNFATKLLSGDQRGITKVHGQPRPVEIAGHRLYLYPIFHPAAALYTPAMKATLQEDFSRLPALLAHAAPQAGETAEQAAEAAGLAAQRPAWRPPDRYRTFGASGGGEERAPAPAGTDEATMFAGAPELSFDDAPAGAELSPPDPDPAASTADPAPTVEPSAPTGRTAAAAERVAAPTAEAAPEPTAEAAGDAAGEPVEPDEPDAGSSEARPLAEPEQLGLF